MDGLAEAMKWLGERPDTLFLGQGVLCGGTKMAPSFKDVPTEKLIEMPVAENLQMGISIGLSLEGFVPVSVFPRVDFLLCAADQLVLHLDKLPLYSSYRPKVIIRTAVGAKQPLDAGPQHTGDYAKAMDLMLKTVLVRSVSLPALQTRDDETAVHAYRKAYEETSSTIVVE